MAKTANKPAKSATSTRAKKTKEEPKTPQREVLYPKLASKICVADKAINLATGMKLLGWETEAEYKARRLSENPNLKESAATFGDDFMFVEPLSKQKVRCWNNSVNRPFDLTWSLKIAQDILCSGPGVPEDKRYWKFNGENIIIGKTGLVLSGQHRLVALVLANLIWADSKESYYWKEIWPTPPTLDTALLFGVEEDQSLIRTLDTTKPRTFSDSIYTSGVFDDFTPRERTLVSKMLDSCVKVVWTRTGEHAFKKYQTTGASTDFLDCHPYLTEAVRFIFTYENGSQGHNVLQGSLRLNPGHCAGLLYLMAAGKTDRITYLNAEDGPSEKHVDLSLKEDARKFWRLVCANSDEVKPMADALRSLQDEAEGTGGREPAKHAIVCKAWNAYVENGRVDEEDVALEYVDRDGVQVLNDFPDVGGIDFGPPKKSPGPDEDKLKRQQEREEKKAKQKAEKSKENQKRRKASDEVRERRVHDDPRLAELERKKEKHEGRLLLFKKRDGEFYQAFGDDAETVAKHCDTQVRLDEGIKTTQFREESLAEVIEDLNLEDISVAVFFTKNVGGKEKVKYRNHDAHKIGGKPVGGKPVGGKPVSGKASSSGDE